MTQLINDAYAKIEAAPLRHYAEPRVPVGEMWAGNVGAMPRTKFEDKPDPFRKMERVGFWVKFGIGAVVGAFLGAGAVFHLYTRNFAGWPEPRPFAALAIVVGCMLLFGFAYAYTKNDEKFWDVILRRPWWRRWPW